MLFIPPCTGGRNLPATIVPGKPGFDHAKSNSVLFPGSEVCFEVPLPTTVYPDGTVICICAVNRSVYSPVIGNQRPGYIRMLTGSAIAASFTPSTGLVSAPVSVPEYSK